MGQNEIYAKVLELRKQGDDSYYSALDIGKMISPPLSRYILYRSIRSLLKSRHIEYDRESMVMCVMNNRPIIKKYRLADTREKTKFVLKP